MVGRLLHIIMNCALHGQNWSANILPLGPEGVPDDLEKYGKIKKKRAELEIAMNCLTWFNTAKVGYIYAKTTPRNAGKLLWPDTP